MSTITRHIRRVAPALFIASFGLVAAAVPKTTVGAIAPGFTDTTVISGLNFPTTVQFAPNGDIFISEKAGIIKRYTSLTDTTPDIVADLRLQVYNYWDKGLLGLAVDPQYPTRPYVYALFSYDAMIGGQFPKWGNANDGGNDPCLGSPDGPGSTVDGCTSSGRLVRLTVGSNGVSTAQKVLVEDWCGQFPSHSIGTVAFGPDGYLYAGAGDGASFATSYRDYGEEGGTVINPATGQPYTPKNPCGDPPGGVGGDMTVPTAEGGSLRAQDKQTTGDPTALNGSIIRIDPDTGLAVSTNPSYTNGQDENDRRILVYGLRNPYRFTFRPGTNELWIGDVGDATWEEIDRVTNPAGSVHNMGWPCYEGSPKSPGWDALNINMCENLYAQGASAVTSPYYQYHHSQALFTGDTCATGGGVVSGMQFYRGGSYPSNLNNALFFTDYGRDCIWAMRAGSNGLPDSTQIQDITDTAQNPVDLQVGPNNDIFYVDHNGGAIHRLVYTAGNQAPTVVATATPTSGPAPLTVNFDASGSSDPDGDTITYAWDLDGDGQYNDATTATTSRQYAAGTWHPAVKVTDSHGASSTKSFTITSGNAPPTPVIDTPQASLKWAVGDTISFTGHANDVEDGTEPASRLSWNVVLHHCDETDPTACHIHNVQGYTGVSSGSFTAPDHEFTSYLTITLTATDSAGLSASTSIDLQPKTVNLTFATNPTGLTLTEGATTGAAPLTDTYIVNGAVALIAPTSQTVNGVKYTFKSWSDGGAASHTINAPAAATTYTATYQSNLPADARNNCANATTASPQNVWNYNTISSSTDIDWYLFNLSSSSYVMVTAGGLPANYRLDLYSSCSTLIASSNRSGTQFEELFQNLAAGSYRVKISGVSGAFNASLTYGVRFRPIAAGVQILSSSGWTDSSGNIVVTGELINNNPDHYRLAQATATYYDGAGTVLGKASVYADVNVLDSRERSPFRIVAAKPAGYSRYTVAVTYSAKTTDLVVQNFPVTSSSSGVTTGPWYKGTFTNNNGFNVNWTKTATTLYDTWATVINTSVDWTSPTSIAANTSANYSVSFGQHYSGWNRAVIVIQATQATSGATPV